MKIYRVILRAQDCFENPILGIFESMSAEEARNEFLRVRKEILATNPKEIYVDKFKTLLTNEYGLRFEIEEQEHITLLEKPTCSVNNYDVLRAFREIEDRFVDSAWYDVLDYPNAKDVYDIAQNMLGDSIVSTHFEGKNSSDYDFTFVVRPTGSLIDYEITVVQRDDKMSIRGLEVFKKLEPEELPF